MEEFVEALRPDATINAYIPTPKNMPADTGEEVTKIEQARGNQEPEAVTEIWPPSETDAEVHDTSDSTMIDDSIKKRKFELTKTHKGVLIGILLGFILIILFYSTEKRIVPRVDQHLCRRHIQRNLPARYRYYSITIVSPTLTSLENGEIKN